jgi:epoxyqueuosine reductase
MKKLLLHTCCAPCTTYTFDWLKENEFEVTGFFYNPNIHPAEEYEKRRKCFEDYSLRVNLPAVFIDNDLKTRAGDCWNCYGTRLYAAARFAKNNGFESFTTTLLISPYQKHDMIRAAGEMAAEEAGIEFFYHDFREGFSRSRQLSFRHGLYRQKYCACEASLSSRRKKHEQIAGVA